MQSVVLHLAAQHSAEEAHARVALEYITKHESVPLDNLLIVHQNRRIYPLLGRRFIAFAIFDHIAYLKCLKMAFEVWLLKLKKIFGMVRKAQFLS